MDNYDNRHENEEHDINSLLEQYQNLLKGKSNSYIEEDGFQQLIEYYANLEEYQQALKVLENALEQYPQSIDLHLQKVNQFISLNRYNEAWKLLKSIEPLVTENAFYYTLKVEILVGLDKPWELQKVIDVIIKKYSGNELINLLLDLVDIFTYHFYDEWVFDAYKYILQEKPYHKEALINIGFWAEEAGKIDESIKLHQQLVHEHPMLDYAWFNLGMAYHSVKLYEKAIDALLNAVAINGELAQAYFFLSVDYIKTKKYKSAIDTIEDWLAFDHENMAAYELLANTYLRLKQYKSARVAFKKTLTRTDNDAAVYANIAKTYLHESNIKAAIKNLELAQKIDPKNYNINLALGDVLFADAAYQEAFFYYLLATEFKPKNQAGWLSLIKATYFLEYFEEGLQYITLARKYSGNRAIYDLYEALLLIQLKKIKAAEQAFQTGYNKSKRAAHTFYKQNPILNIYAVINALMLKP